MSSTYPKPWSLSGMFAGSHRVVDANGYEVSLCDDLPTALEIVSAVNSHADLLAACEAAEKFMGTLTQWANSDPAQQSEAFAVLQSVKAAISKARGAQ